MYRRNDPRFRRTLNEISQTFESANESAQSQVFIFTQRYINPCLNSAYSCVQPCVEHCFPPGDERARRNRRSQGRAEVNFDFYDDWEHDETDGLLGWDQDEYDGLLGGGSGSVVNEQPARQRAMSYGTRRDAKGRRKSGVVDATTDATGVPASSYFGLFGRLTGKIGGAKVLKYKPSAANLQEHPGEGRKHVEPEGEPLMEESEGERPKRKHGRSRSGTASSDRTTGSLSSRGDIFPSEDEDDAMELDDEFAMVLERRTTNSGLDDGSSGKTKQRKRPGAGSRKSTGTLSSRSTRNSKRYSRAESSKSPTREEAVDHGVQIVQSLTELKQEEDRAQFHEEADIARRREAAQKLASDRGLTPLDSPSSQTTDSRGMISPDELASPMQELPSPYRKTPERSATSNQKSVPRAESQPSLRRPVSDVRSVPRTGSNPSLRRSNTLQSMDETMRRVAQDDDDDDDDDDGPRSPH